MSREDQEVFKAMSQKPFKIEARDIVLRNFTMVQPNKISLSKNFLNSSLMTLKNNDYVDSYLTTPQFFKTLTNLCDSIMLQPNPEAKKLFMKKALCEINRKLPAQVYIPFVSKSMRNNSVLNICVEEARIFQTKERAPLLLCIEVFRPAEMLIDKPSELIASNLYLDSLASDPSGKLDKKKLRVLKMMQKDNNGSTQYRNQQLKNALNLPTDFQFGMRPQSL
jgi:hypothetical protein